MAARKAIVAAAVSVAPPNAGRLTMLDILYVALAAGFFIAAAVAVRLLERL